MDQEPDDGPEGSRSKAAVETLKRGHFVRVPIDLASATYGRLCCAREAGKYVPRAPNGPIRLGCLYVQAPAHMRRNGP